MPEESAYERLIGKAPERSHMGHVEEEFQRQFTGQETRRARREGVAGRLCQSFVESARDVSEADFRALKELASSNANTRLDSPAVAPFKPKMLYTGSIAATRTPPYDWPWTWSATNGDANGSSVRSNNNTGKMSAFENNGDGGGAASGAVAVGIYFRPPFQGLGFLNVSASPVFNYLWWTYNAFDSSHSDGWLGMYVGAYALDGTFIGARVNTQNFLWNESHSFLDSPDGQGSTSGYGLNNSLFVNSDEFYEIWVWCGGSASGDGDHTFYGSYGGSSLNVAVPWIHWEYFGGD